MYPNGYQKIALIVKRYVVLNILLKALAYDRNAINKSQCKFKRVYDEELYEKEWKIGKSINYLKKEMVKIGASIIEEFQEESVRVVKVKYDNYIYSHRYINYMLKTECEQLLKEILKDEFKMPHELFN